MGYLIAKFTDCNKGKKEGDEYVIEGLTGLETGGLIYVIVCGFITAGLSVYFDQDELEEGVLPIPSLNNFISDKEKTIQGNVLRVIEGFLIGWGYVPAAIIWALIHLISESVKRSGKGPPRKSTQERSYQW
tara:strand:- start:889 stop:1281 length:393 start_codon:yes stop_codon:yes gene_type:complete